MYHKLLIIVVLVFCGCSSSKYGVIPSNKYIIPYSEMPFGNAKEFFGSDWELYVIDFFTPTLDETIIADSIIYMAIDSIASDWNKCNSWIHNRDKITSKNLSKYIRQYSGHINNNGEKEIHVSFIALEFANQYSLKELNSPISVSDGGTEHWCITINLKTRQASDFYVNGFAYLFNEIFGNKIVAVNDASEDEAFGLAPRFASGAYADAVGYDANGNITRDDTRAISSVSYHPFLNLPKKVSFTDGSYLMWDYRPDGKKVKSTSAEKYIRVTVTVNADGDTIVRQHSQFNTDTRTYLGAFEISGSTWRVFHQAGHTDIASSGTVTNRFYLRDYLGSTAAVIDENGDVLQSTVYFPSGLPLTPNNLAPQTIRLHTGKDYFGLQDAGWYDNRARYYDCILARFTTQDPLAEKYPWLTPYNHCANNPLKFVDMNGMNPIYNREGYLIGTADNGIQGEPIIMDAENFHDKITLEEAQKLDLGVAGLLNNDAIERYNNSIKSLSDRPDWDGYITLDEANNWYKNGNGEPLYADINKIDFSGIVSLGENYVGQVKTFNLLLNSNSLIDGLVYGNITLKRYPNHSIRAYSDKYDFDMKSWSNPSNWGRNIETLIGSIVAGNGTAFNINIYGSTSLRPKYP